MVRVSNFIITFLNCVTLLVSLVAIGFSIWLNFNHSATLCQKVLQKPLLILGVCLLVVSILGLIGSLCRVSFILWIYLFLLFLLIVGLLCFTLFAILVTNKNVSKALSGRGYKEIKSGDYTNWLQKYVVNEENWGEIKSCLVDTKFCQHIPTGKGADFYKYRLSPIQVLIFCLYPISHLIEQREFRIYEFQTCQRNHSHGFTIYNGCPNCMIRTKVIGFIQFPTLYSPFAP